MPRWRTALACALALAVGGCFGSGDKDRDAGTPAGVLTVYASLPAGGLAADEGAAVEDGIRLALSKAQWHAGRVPLRLTRLDSTGGTGQPWDPGHVQANADRASDDRSAIAYIGELDLGASAVSVPVTNDAGLLQVSPYDGLTSLTRVPPGRAGRGAPDRYYPTGRRSFLRLAPTDLREVDLIAGRLRTLGAGRVGLVTEDGVYAGELASQVSQRVRRDGGTVVASEALEEDPGSARSVVDKLQDAGPDAIVYAGIGDQPAYELLAELSRRLPGTPVLASGGVMVRRPRRFGAAPAQVETFSALRPVAGYGAWGRRVLRELRRAYGPAAARPEALYGYESARVVLDAVRAGGRRRAAVVRAGLRSGGRVSPLGPFFVHGNGEVTGEPMLMYRLREGRFEPLPGTF